MPWLDKEDLRQLGAAGTAVLRSKMLVPPGPRAASRMFSAFWRFGPTAALPIAISAARWPERVALVDDDGKLTYRDLVGESEALADALAASYQELQSRRAHSVGVFCRNHRGFVIALLAGCLLGKEIVFINYDLTAKQLAPLLSRHGIDLMLHDEDLGQTLDEAGYTGRRAVPTDPSAVPRKTAGRRRRTPSLLPVEMTLLTSGTTGAPKGVPRAIRPVAGLFTLASALAATRLRSGQVAAVTSPLFHGLGIAAGLGFLALGDTVLIRRRYSADLLYRDIEEHGVEVIMTVPTVLARLTEAARAAERARDMSSLKLVLSGGALLPAPVVRDFTAAFGPVAVNGYGTTELGIISFADPRDLAEEPATVGRPIVGASVKILRPDRTEAAVGESGVIFAKGTAAYAGYTPDPNAKVKAKEVVAGHISTGDMGHFDAKGLLYVDGREDDMIVSGGENIFPSEVEEALLAHPSVADAAVVGVPDSEFGQCLRAFLVLRQGAARVEDDALKAFLRDSLERYKIPKQFHVLPELPRNPSGKVLRTTLATLD
ncbi:AMP-binding protein [Segniliparus rugosus]|uniref:Fatty-acyl-CoA synthase n=1 Tax=Segniliparus rugosus (strain ATCC BAA-974 / DSM 45345 / CCUG 50838 / CIP 108380 / JCM 13579 / CDC 945) TaxID=679197 RepID=E5XN98_SEGRC|nr:AMP-binding protein [Segniliparus rugosus]EFV14194.2 hypothetical protein HMPREF9336_00968 [Segniliparus rugosus ATCC BAA-974]